MNKNRLNNFILWCKGWYVPVNENISLFEQAKSALYLDEYICIQNNRSILDIVMTYIDDLVYNNVIKPIRMQMFYDEVTSNKHWYNLTDDEALLWTIRNFFAWGIDKKVLQLNPPIYNRNTYKLGFTGPEHLGNSYKMLTYKANNFFKRD